MTKKELKQEAQEYVSSVASGTAEEMELYARFYIDSAEPREKRIAELEQKLEQTEKDLADYQFNYPTIKELQKENAELKEELRKESEIISCDSSCYDNLLEIKDNLTKAKELLNEFMRISKASDEDFEHDYSELIGDTEQFLSEVEK